MAKTTLTCFVNGEHVRERVDTRTTLLDFVRERLDLTGTKKGCNHGQCGACTLHLNGRRVLSCLTLAAACENARVTTIEGVAGKGRPHPVQAAFIAHDAFQCGYCTSGQIMSALAMLEEPWDESDDAVREAMSGNLCRCGAYPNIVSALKAVRGVPRNA